jgi:hypothetical protein
MLESIKKHSSQAIEIEGENKEVTITFVVEACLLWEMSINEISS